MLASTERMDHLHAHGHACMLVHCAPAAMQWRLSWMANCRRPDLIASVFCRQLYVNPQGLDAVAVVDSTLQPNVSIDYRKIPPPISASFTFSLNMSSISMALLAGGCCSGPPDASTNAHILNTLAWLSAKEFCVKVQSWSGEEGAVALDAGISASIEYVESTTMCSIPLINEFTVRCSYAMGKRRRRRDSEEPQGSLSNMSSRVAGEDDQSVNTSNGHPWESDCVDTRSWTLVPLRRQPDFGTSVTCKFETPINAIMEELTLQDFRRLWAALQNTEEYSPPMKLTNSTDIDLWAKQCGAESSGQTVVPRGTSVGYHWPCPPGLCPDARLALQLTFLPTEKTDSVSWSSPLEIMTPGGTSAALEKAGTVQIVAVQVCWEDCFWHVKVKPGLRIVNHHRHAIFICHRAGPNVECSPIGMGGFLDVACDGQPLRFWLGEQKWTKEIAAKSNAEEEEVEVRLIYFNQYYYFRSGNEKKRKKGDKNSTHPHACLGVKRR